MPLLTPRRRRGHEYLDDPAVNARVAERSMADVVRSNTLFGGTHAVLAELATTFELAHSKTLTMLDVGTGLGDIPARAREAARRRGIALTTIGLDNSEVLALAARSSELPAARADARHLPIRDRGVDIVICSQLLHHFGKDEAVSLVRELDRVARMRVIISDIRRSWLAAAGIWLASFPLRFHPVSRHDGVISVLRGFTRSELRELVRLAVRHSASVHRRRGFRMTASWTPIDSL